MSAPEPARAAGIWTPEHVWVTLGAVAMVFLAAAQSLAVTTVMPLVSADLDGAALYAVAVAGTLATSVIGMVAVGAWCDRQGPTLPLTTAVALFVAAGRGPGSVRVGLRRRWRRLRRRPGLGHRFLR